MKKIIQNDTRQRKKVEVLKKTSEPLVRKYLR
jgi:hypothetical protein